MKDLICTCRFLFVIVGWLMIQQGNAQILVTKRDISCKGEADGYINLTVPNATPPLTYAWQDGLSGNPRDHLTAGTYRVTVTDATKCDHTKSIVIEEPDEKLDFTIETLPTPLPHPCHTAIPVIVSVIAKGGTPPYNINGQQGRVQRIFTFNSTTKFTYSVSDAKGCNKQKTREYLIGEFVCAVDPNDIAGPSGYEEERWVSKQDTLPYTIRFENDPLLASAPAQQVLITHTFDDDINPFSFRLGTFGFGTHNYAVPPNTSSFQQRYDLTAELGVFVDVVAGLDIDENRAFWLLSTVDPLTNQRPLNPLIGFLPVNDTLTGSGEGFVTFSARPKSSAITGDTVFAQAEIIFDESDPIITNIWTNVIDALPPTSTLDTILPIAAEKEIALSWSGADDTGGCGLAAYQLYVSTNEGPFEPAFICGPDTLQYVFTGEYGNAYAFYVIGIDFVDNREVKTLAETNVYVLPRREITIYPAAQDVYCIRDTIALDFSTILVASVDIVMTTDSGETFISLATDLDTAQSPFAFILPDSLADHTLAFIFMDHDSMQIRDTLSYLLIKGFPDVDAGDDVSACAGEQVYLIPDGANDYFWYPQIALNYQTAVVQGFTADSSLMQFVMGTDAFGCRNIDSLFISVFPVSLDSLLQPLCEGDSLFIDGEWVTEAGFYSSTLGNVHGCDSTVVTEVYFESPCIWTGGPYVYVDQDATGYNNGTSWLNAFTDLQDALYIAGRYENVQEIWVAAGVYKPHQTLRDTSFVLTDSIKIFGGFLGIETSRAERSSNAELVKISGDINIADTIWDNSYHTVSLESSCVDCVLDGLTVQYGYADELANAHDIGAGVINKGDGTFYNVIFERNYATDLGAALHSSGASVNLIIENCTFRLNTSSLGRDVVNLAGANIEFRGANSIH